MFVLAFVLVCVIILGLHSPLGVRSHEFPRTHPITMLIRILIPIQAPMHAPNPAPVHDHAHACQHPCQLPCLYFPSALIRSVLLGLPVRMVLYPNSMHHVHTFCHAFARACLPRFLCNLLFRDLAHRLGRVARCTRLRIATVRRKAEVAREALALPVAGGARLHCLTPSNWQPIVQNAKRAYVVVSRMPQNTPPADLHPPPGPPPGQTDRQTE